MENEQLPAPAPASSSGGSAPAAASTAATRPPGPQISVYSGIPDRQTVQVIQQALHRQPNTAAQYLQQMYAAQQQHLMLQTAALQQQHLTSAQLQSLAAVQQASLAANRQSGSSAGNGAQPAPAQQPTINLATSPAAAQLLNRAQSVGPGASGIAQQAVLLGNAASPALTASQAQMYLRAQMLIFTPTGPVSAVRPESPAPAPPAAPAPAPPPSTPQVHSLALRPAGPHLPALAMKPPGGAPPRAGPPRGPPPDPPAEHLKKAEGPEARAHPLARAAPATAHPLVTTAYAPLQPPQFLQQPPKPVQPQQQQQQFVIQQQQQPLGPRGQPPPAPPGAPQLQPLPPASPGPAPQPKAGVLQGAGGEGGPPNGHPGSCHAAPPRKFQHASAVILQLQPAGPTPPLGVPEGARRDPLPAPRSAESPPAAPPPPALSPPAAPAGPATPEGERPPAHEPPERLHAQPRIPGMTSGSGSAAATVAGAAPHNGENKPPQAIVKPQILTHVIEGFVIQEGAEPFPVGRSSLLVGALHKQYAQELLPDKLPPQDNTTTTDSDMEEPYLQESKEEGNPPKLKCELCGRVDFAYKFKRSKRFCSMACAKRYNVGCTKRVGLFHPDRTKLQKPGGPPHGRRRSCKGTLPPLGKDSKKQLNHSQEDSSRCSDNSSYEEPLSPISASSSTSRRRQGERDLELRDMELPDVHGRDLPGLGHRFLPSEPSKWNVEDVYEFIRSLPGCQEIAEEFRAQEIDGQALLLLKEDHLMSTMNIKLGPALKIYARINMLKDS
ncbi:LOW QUALITY PROTEIN: polyhomeotic-like protein 2 [Manacus candei]|uniref:LOW QUALITY PROTEIN: polyhomeotic-like protein 2 n=1 Tax=Manacus candei TaxID=415023 RepID=UPI002225DA08|nr:LOW QUALITY PROTEIN: polyhomeotic-like protein 2 [Manacus candei]